MPRTLVEGKAPKRRLQYGLPFKQFPAGDITPESMINEQTRTGRQEIQQRFTLAWDEINRSRKFIGVGKAKRMQRELHTKAKQEMLQFNQKAETEADQLDRINRLAEQGLIYNADELKTRMVFGSDVARSMYPETRSVEQQFGTLDISLSRVGNRLAQFRRPKKRVSTLLGRKGKFGWPLPKEGITPGELEVWDRSLTKEVDNELITGDWRPATQQEVAEHRMLVREEQRIKRLQTDILGRPGVKKRIVQPGTTGGTFSDKIAESVDGPRTKRHDPLGLFE